MDSSYYKQYEPVFGSWHMTRLIGEGSFGKVFEIEREDFGTTYKAALKAVTIPSSQSEVQSVLSEGMDEGSVRTYFGSFVQELVKEFALMSRLKGNSNVVSYEDHQVIEHRDGIGWDILIRMELLTPLDSYIRKHKTVSRQEIIRLGIDLCRALELCQKHNIIHRDIKPENIFISENGDFKLGDFGVARTVEKTTGGLSKKGTYLYMAPEVYKGEAYGSTVDIYSLGLVLYRLLNGNRAPFLPLAPAPVTYGDREKALARRYSGEPLPLPSHGEGRLAEIVLKACAYEPKDRYSSPGQMRQELEAILYSEKEGRYIYPDGDQVPQDSVHTERSAGRKTDPDREPARQEEEKTVSDFERTVSDFGKTVSDFGETVSGFGKTEKQKNQSRKSEVSLILEELLPLCAKNGLNTAFTKCFLGADILKREREIYEEKMIAPAVRRDPAAKGQDILGVLRQSGNFLNAGTQRALAASLLFLDRGIVAMAWTGNPVFLKNRVLPVSEIRYIPYRDIRRMEERKEGAYRWMEIDTAVQAFGLGTAWLNQDRLRDLLNRLSGM